MLAICLLLFGKKSKTLLYLRRNEGKGIGRELMDFITEGIFADFNRKRIQAIFLERLTILVAIQSNTRKWKTE